MIHEENNDFRSVCPILALSTIRKRWADLLVCYKNSQGSFSKINAIEWNRNGEAQRAHSMSPLVPIPALLSEHTLCVCGPTQPGHRWKPPKLLFKKCHSSSRLKNSTEDFGGHHSAGWKIQTGGSRSGPPGTLCAFYQKSQILHHSPSWQRFWCLLYLQLESRCCQSLLQCW